jgi:hypothetical protein
MRKNMQRKGNKTWNTGMERIHEVLSPKLLEAMPVSAEDWEQTPKSVQNWWSKY